MTFWSPILPAMDAVFKALADPTRRSLLDELYKQDGQSLKALEGGLEMTRFGVMKHLRVLEEAGLVTTQKRGRKKLHFLNPVPIRLIHDRWVSKYAEPFAATLTGLKQALEERTMQRLPEAGFQLAEGDTVGVFEIFIKTTPERLWEAITDPKQRAKYSFGVETHSDWTPGSEYGPGPRGGRHRLGREPRGRAAAPPRPSFRAWSDE